MSLFEFNEPISLNLMGGSYCATVSAVSDSLVFEFLKIFRLKKKHLLSRYRYI